MPNDSARRYAQYYAREWPENGAQPPYFPTAQAYQRYAGQVNRPPMAFPQPQQPSLTYEQFGQAFPRPQNALFDQYAPNCAFQQSPDQISALRAQLERLELRNRYLEVRNRELVGKCKTYKETVRALRGQFNACQNELSALEFRFSAQNKTIDDLRGVLEVVLSAKNGAGDAQNVKIEQTGHNEQTETGDADSRADGESSTQSEQIKIEPIE